MIGAVAIFLGIAFFAWTMVPHLQMRGYVKIIKHENIGAPNRRPHVFEPFTYVQADIRDGFLNRVIAGFEQGKVDQDVAMDAISKLEEVIARESNYPKYYYTLARAYTTLASKNRSEREMYLKKAEEYCRRVYELVPTNPETAQVYSVILLNQGKFNEARKTLEDSLVLVDTEDTHLYLGVTLVQIGPREYVKALEHLEMADPHVNPGLVIATYKKLFVYFSGQGDVERLLIIVRKLKELDLENKEIYEHAEVLLIKRS